MSPIILFVVFACTMASISAINYPPVILVPGVAGSQLEAKVSAPPQGLNTCGAFQWWLYIFYKNRYFTVWLNPLIFFKHFDKCAVKLFEMNFNNVTRKTTDLPGIQIRGKGFGDPYWVEKFEYNGVIGWFMSVFNFSNLYYKDLADALYSYGYERNVSLRGAPYDFRKGPNESEEYFNNLKNLVEETYRINGNRKVVFVTHSYGGPMTVLFLQTQTQQWKDKYIRAMITLAAVLGGTVKSIRVLATGDEFTQAPYYLYSDMKIILRSFPSLSFLMPNEKLWKDEVLVRGPEKNYSLSNLEEFFQELDDSRSWEMRKDQLPYTSMEPPGVEFHCVYSTTETDTTTEMLTYDDPANFPGSPEFVFGPGDGTVNLRSLDYCKKWTEQQNQKGYVKHFPNMNHMEIVYKPKTINYILRVLSGYAKENDIYEKH